MHDALLPLLRRLRANATHTARVAAAGREFASTHLTFGTVLRYMRSLLAAFAKLRVDGFAAAPSAAALRADGFVRVAQESDLVAVTGMCDRCTPAAGKKKGEPGPSLAASCVAARHAAGRGGRARCTLWAPKGGGRCFDAGRCCKGWDCPTRPLPCLAS